MTKSRIGPSVIAGNHRPRVWTRERSGSAADKHGANSPRARDPCASGSRTVEEGWLWMRPALAGPAPVGQQTRVNSPRTAARLQVRTSDGAPYFEATVRRTRLRDRR